MVNYFWLEYFRRLTGKSMNEMSEAAGCTGEQGRKSYSRWLERRANDIADDNIKGMAEAVGIIPEWITQSPIVYTKDDLDNYLAAHKRNTQSPLVKPSAKINQYEIVSQDAALALRDLAEQLRGTTPEQEIEILKTSFKVDPDYVKMPLRPMSDYALLHFNSLPEFAKTFAASNREVISDKKLNALVSKLVMARTLPATTVDRAIFDCFVGFANITLDQALCDFRVSSHQSVFNLFLAAYISLSPWTIKEDEKLAAWVLTLTDPALLPSTNADGGLSMATDLLGNYPI